MTGSETRGHGARNTTPVKCWPGQVVAATGALFTVGLQGRGDVTLPVSAPMAARGIQPEVGQWVAVSGTEIVYRWKELQDPQPADWGRLIAAIPDFVFGPACGNHDAQAEYYDQNVRRDLGDYVRENYFSILDRVVAWAELLPGLAVLDVGVGTGLLTERLPGGLDLFGVDVSEKMLAKLREKDLPIDLRLGEFTALPFPDASFDRILSTFAFHHLDPDDKQRAFREFDRVLRPEGRLVIGDFMVEDGGQRAALLRRFQAESRADLLREMDEEWFLDISAEAVPPLHRLGYHVEWERGSTLSWILRATRV